MIIALLFAPVLALLYVVYLMLKAVVVIILLPFSYLERREQPTIGRLDPDTDKVHWNV